MDDRVVAVINLKAIKDNIDAIKTQLNAGVKIMSVLKANAYGHGAVAIAQYIYPYIDYIAVATLNEGIALRKNGITLPILVLGEIITKQLARSLKYNISATVFNEENLSRYIRFGKRYNAQIPVHIAIDTGMNRIGLRYDDFDKIFFAFSSKNLKIEGLFTHLAQAENAVFTEFQKNNYNNVLSFLQKNSLKVPFCHISNSEGCKNKSLNYDCVRIGISQFVSADAVNGNAMQLLAKIVQIKTVKKGECIGYDCSYIVKEDSTIATLSIGYADGLPRILSNKGKVLINGATADIVGKICMDYTMINITGIAKISVGDYVTIWGKEPLSADTVAGLAGTISYELFTNLSDRVKRIYLR